MGGDNEYRYLRFATEHHLPMVNGVSSFVPRRFFEFANESREKLLDDLHAIGVRLVIVHGAPIDDRRLHLVQRFDDDWVYSFDSYSNGYYSYSRSTTGALDEPQQNAYFRYKARFAGSASSPYGIRRVNLLFDNGGVRMPATLTGSHFAAEFTQRPSTIRRDTDVQVEIIDGRGETTLLDGRWFWWGP